MQAWEEVQATIDYIETHLQKDLKAIDLAKMAHLSAFYYQRLFTRLVGRPFLEYVKMRRLAKASELLLKTENKILDIALECGFRSHAAFTKAFKNAYKLTPESFRRERPLLNQVVKPELMMKYVLIDEGVPLITEHMFLEINRKKLLKKETYLGYVGKLSIASHIPIGGATGVSGPEALWDKFQQVKPHISAILPDGPELGASFLRDKTLDPMTLGPDEAFDYFVGGQSDGTLVEGMEEWVLDAGEYIVCSFETEASEAAKSEAIAKALNYLLGTWLPKHQLITEPYSVEKYCGTKDNISCMEIWVAPLPKV